MIWEIDELHDTCEHGKGYDEDCVDCDLDLDDLEVEVVTLQ